jgi:hypothetical protein
MLPYMPEGAEIRVKGHGKPTSIPPAPKSRQLSPVPIQEENFHILIIVSDFSEMNKFRTKAQGIKNLLLSKEPFASKSSKIVSTYENTANIGCYSGCSNINRLMCCNPEKVTNSAVASGKLHDEIIVIHNTKTYSGGGYSSYNMVYNRA